MNMYVYFPWSSRWMKEQQVTNASIVAFCTESDMSTSVRRKMGKNTVVISSTPFS